MKILLLLAALGGTAEAAGVMSAKLGPPSVGQGGSNPVSIPPADILDWQLSYVNTEGNELLVSVIPGIYYGQRWQTKQLYVSLGGGLMITPGGLGPGATTAIGYSSERWFDTMGFEAEYRQVLGYSRIGLELPYALRVGLFYAF